MLDIIHETHQGIIKCKQRAREAPYWLEMSAQIEEKVQDCSICHDYSTAQQKEPLMPSEVPEFLWSHAASDIFEFERDSYLVLVDYYSKYVEVSKLGELSSLETIKVLKEHFARHGIPSKLITDCGSQYASKEFGSFAESYNFEHVLVSPKYSKANGEAEAAVKTVKSLWRKNKDKNKALLDYRATPILDIDLSPSQLCTGHRLRTTLPTAKSLLKPEAHNSQEIKRRMKEAKDEQKYYHDQRSAKDLPLLKPGDHVRIKPNPGFKEWKAATVLEQHTSPRSYTVDTGERRLLRNRVNLRKDSAKSYMGYCARHPSVIPDPAPAPNTETASQVPATTPKWEQPPQNSKGERSPMHSQKDPTPDPPSSAGT